MKKNFNETAYSRIFFPQNDYIFFLCEILKRARHLFQFNQHLVSVHDVPLSL